MQIEQTTLLLIFGLLNLIVFIKSWREVLIKQNPFGLTRWLSWLGIFVWGDAVVIAPFWIISALLSLFLRDWILFWLIVSIFWSVRSLGEVIYWLNEQFAAKKRNPPHTLPGYLLVKSEAIWFIFQIYWQCVMVVSIVSAIFFAKNW